MSQLHLTDDQLIDLLYGVHPAGDPHLKACPHCASRLGTLRERRGQAIEEIPEGAVLWSEQRRRVLERVEHGAETSWTWRRAWAPALVTAVVVAAGVWLYEPSRPSQPEAAPVAVDYTDAGWFEETYSVTQPDEPRAAGPIRVLFEHQEEAVTE